MCVCANLLEKAGKYSMLAYQITRARYSKPEAKKKHLEEGAGGAVEEPCYIRTAVLGTGVLAYLAHAFYNSAFRRG
jgi:hypothetical protein